MMSFKVRFTMLAAASALIAVGRAGDFGSSDGGDYGNHVGGYGDGGSQEEHYPPQPYKFGYKVNEEWGQQHREEQADGHGNVVGSYGFTDAHGIYRQVNYIADKFGFRAQIKTNEPGTAPSAPADAHIQSSAPQATGHHGQASGAAVSGGDHHHHHGSDSSAVVAAAASSSSSFHSAAHFGEHQPAAPVHYHQQQHQQHQPHQQYEIVAAVPVDDGHAYYGHNHGHRRASSRRRA